MAGDSGTCGFCGAGEGWLGATGDETSQILHAAVRSGETGKWTYETHPNAFDHNYIMWCGTCEGGLIHKWQRYDDTNLRALKVSYEVRLELDGIRWSNWDNPEIRKFHQDDTAVHVDKLCIERDIRDISREIVRRMRAEIDDER